MKAAWKGLKHELMAATARDFERMVFPWLKLMTPELVAPTALKELDRKGIDMAYVVPGALFPLVIQCKGFEVTQEELGPTQIALVRDSVDTFLKSGYHCRRYVLLYNRGGNNRGFAGDALKELARLSGVADEASVWSLDDLLKEVDRELTTAAMDALTQWSERMEQQRRPLFSFDDVVIEDVPAFKRHWSLSVGASAGVLRDSKPIASGAIREELMTRREGHYTLVIGSYGMGKTTLMRHFEMPPGYSRVLIPAGALLHVIDGGGSENALLEHLLRHTGCLADLSDHSNLDLKRLERMGSTCLAGALHSGTAMIVLIIDGLDENRLYSRADGFLLLANELGKLRVPMVLTTRKEHFFNSYQDLQPEHQRVWLSRSVNATVIELEEWSAANCLSMLRRIGAKDPEHAKGLAPLESHLGSGALPLVFSHPLWLAMAIDLALAGQAHRFEDSPKLYDMWTEQKFLRDFSARGRDIPESLGNSSIFVRTMDRLMIEVATRMCVRIDADLQLREEIAEEEVEQVARSLIRGEGRLDTLIVQTSLLAPTSVRTTRAPLRLRFSHYSFQEYYTARAIQAGLISPGEARVPDSVKAFLR
jgi:hypothetical protein